MAIGVNVILSALNNTPYQSMSLRSEMVAEKSLTEVVCLYDP